MKKTSLAILAIIFLELNANAQTEGAVNKLSIGADIALPTTEGSKNILLAGGSAYYEDPIAKSFNLTGSLGYLSMFSTEKNVSGSLGFSSIKLGGKYYFGKNYYGALQAGVTLQREGGVSYFAYSPGLGASFSVSSKSSLDFALRYENWSRDGSSLGLIGLRIAYAFGL
ncbi:hypothetical protein [Pedobacter agri]|uniref:Outer membrane protein beta-barrel domain-containing protein n=1 Tax=Pedobacter agri TaxID=454586 RepID=A0A9X3DD09_9SPHI|nr:hypothetical protein [Pedobacter agri]MCX3264931.1 hypothetical protein [Pedobacter agri]